MIANNVVLKAFLSHLLGFFGIKRNRRLFYLGVICALAIWEFTVSGLARRTFIFYSNSDGKSVIENRMLFRSSDKETNIRRYVDEVLLGPATPDTAPLFVRETQLDSFMYRDGIVYVNLTETAALPPGGAWDTFRSLLTLNTGIRRNFSQVKDVRLFIDGNEVFFEEFREFFSNSAYIAKTLP